MTFTPLATARRTKHQRDYFVYDQYNTALAAGSINNTQAEPVGGGRVVVDTNSKISIAGGQLDFATGAASHDGVFYGLQNRIAGRVVKAVIIRPDAAGQMGFGWTGALSGAATDRVLFAATNVLATVNTGAVVIGTSSATTYDVACIMRSTGHFYFVKGGLYDKWKPLFISQVGSTNRYGVVQAGSGTTNPFKADDFRIPKFNYIPVPLQSDGMSATTTDGLGNSENNGVAGSAYTNIGTWGVTGGKRTCTVLSGALGFSYLSASSSNVIVEAVCTRTGGNTGLVARYVDANNYLIAYHDGTNAKLDKVVAGVTTNLLTAVVTYSATAVMQLHLDDTTARLFYGTTAIGTSAVTPAAGSLNFGVYTTNIAATFDNLVIWAKGNEGQYEDMEQL